MPYVTMPRPLMDSQTNQNFLPTDSPPPINWIDRLRAGLEVLMVALLGDFFVAPLVLSVWGIAPEIALESASILCPILVFKATFVLVLIRVLLGLRGERVRDLGWGRLSVRGETLRGLAFVPVLFGVVAAVGIAFQAILPDFVSETNPLLELVKRPSDVILFVITGIYVGGVQEEVQRAYVLRHFERYFGGAIRGLLLWSVFFGWGHSLQGVDNAVKAALLGLLFGLLYLRRRDLTSPIAAHAGFDVAMILVFWFFIR